AFDDCFYELVGTPRNRLGVRLVINQHICFSFSITSASRI
ncbi:hypothetical protein AVDCRST_MAG92-4127, partial [uncultured Coleofasciculus sp.]